MDGVKENAKIGARVLYLDYLRILATIFVILIHVTAQNWGNVEMMSYPWRVFNLLNNACRWAVPMFVMLSGALFLDPRKQVTVKGLYWKNILRMLITYIVWASVYALDAILSGMDLADAKMTFLNGYYHMWYFYLVVGLYIATPVVRKITESKETAEYFLVITLFFVVILPEGMSMLRVLEVPHTASVLSALKNYTTGMNFVFPNVFLIYYVMGCYLSMYDIGPWLRKTVYVLGVASYLGVILGMEYMVKETGTIELPFGLQFANVSMTAAMFLFGKYVLSNICLSEKWANVMKKISRYTFGVYLVHVLVLEKLSSLAGLHTLSFDPMISVVVILLLVWSISVLISFVLNQIPILKRYIV